MGERYQREETEEMVMPRRGRGGALFREFDSDYECSARPICVPRFDANRYNHKNRITNRAASFICPPSKWNTSWNTFFEALELLCHRGKKAGVPSFEVLEFLCLAIVGRQLFVWTERLLLE